MMMATIQKHINALWDRLDRKYGPDWSNNILWLTLEEKSEYATLMELWDEADRKANPDS